MKINSKKTLLFFCLFYFAIANQGRGMSFIFQEQVSTFREFLLNSLPKGTPWFYKSNNAKQQKQMKRILKNAVPLKFFKPYCLIKLIHWNPAAGFPGSVMHDYRVLYNPKENKFELSSLNWINNYRQRSSLEIDKLSPQDIQSYIEELVSLIPRLDCFGFNVVKIIIEKPLHVKVFYDNMHNRRSKPIEVPKTDIIIFNVNGVIIKSGLLELEFMKSIN